MPHHPLGQFDSHHGGLFPRLRLAVSTAAARANTSPPLPGWLTGRPATTLLATALVLLLCGYTTTFAFLVCGLPVPDWTARVAFTALLIGSAIGAIYGLTATLWELAHDLGNWLNGPTSSPPTTPPGPATPPSRHPPAPRAPAAGTRNAEFLVTHPAALLARSTGHTGKSATA